MSPIPHGISFDLPHSPSFIPPTSLTPPNSISKSTEFYFLCIDHMEFSSPVLQPRFLSFATSIAIRELINLSMPRVSFKFAGLFFLHNEPALHVFPQDDFFYWSSFWPPIIRCSRLSNSKRRFTWSSEKTARSTGLIIGSHLFVCTPFSLFPTPSRHNCSPPRSFSTWTVTSLSLPPII
jgi:hypothetical protein